MGKRLKLLSPIVLAGIVILFSLLLAYIFGKEKAQAPMPPATRQSNNMPSQVPAATPSTTTTLEGETLEMCLKRASNSEAQESIILEAQQMCRQRFTH